MDTVVLPVGDDIYAVEITAVREVVAAPRVTPLPTAPAGVLGVFNLRGEITALFDVGSLTGTGAMAAVPFAVVVETALGPAGLAASAAPVSASLREPVGTADAPGTVAIHALGDGFATLLDVDLLLAPARLLGRGG